jgi:phosphohistidine swiveling domain-containing protein
MNFVLTGRDGTNEEAGSKARALAEAARAGLPVPAWFAISGRAAELYSANRPLAVPAGCDESSEQCDFASHDAELTAEVDEAVRGLSAGGELVAVRSSSRDEDGAEHSFAGQLQSFLNVGPADVLDKVRSVWESASTDRIDAYRRERGLIARTHLPAVLVQRMVRARVAGVAFSADPVSGRRGVAVVSAVRGFGSALVSGESDADTWHVDRSDTIVERRVATKRRMHVVDVCSRDGVRSVDVVEGEVNRPVLSDDEVRAVAALARRCARLFGRPQDIEWAYEEDRLMLLQSRPITSLHSVPDPDGAPAIWDNSNIVESYSGVTTPLTFSFASEIYEHVYRQFCRLMRVPEAVVAERDDAFRNLLGLVRGRLYYNILNWYRILALLPGFTLNRSFMEQMMGVKEPLPETVADEIVRSNRRGRIADSLRVARTVAGLIASHLTLERRVRAFYRRLNDALRSPDRAFEELKTDELAAHYRELRRRLLLSWDAPLVNDFFAMIFYGLLRQAARAWCGDREGTLQNDLIGGEGGLVSAEPAARLQQLARIAAASPGIVERLLHGTVDGIRTELHQLPELRSAFESYLDRFGDRTVNELKLESLTLHDDPLPLFRSVGALGAQQALSNESPGSSAGERLRASARERVDRSLARRPVRRLVFGWILRHARSRVRDRENLRFERTRLFARVRRIFVEIGRRLHAQNLLGDPRDVFFLEIDEVLAFIEGRSCTTDLRGLVKLRKVEFAAYESQPEPDSRFETRGVVYQGHDFRGVRTSGELTIDEERRGIGCSPGRVRGPVRVVTDPRSVDLRQRSILVAAHTDPGWVMVFPSALGVLVERGSLLSHAAIVARELGIPAIVSVAGLGGWLKDGDWVEFDGASGVVRRIATPDVREVGDVA